MRTSPILNRCGPSNSTGKHGFFALCAGMARDVALFQGKWLPLLGVFMCLQQGLKAQVEFTFSTSLQGSYHSAGTVGFTDVDNNGWDDLVIFNEGHDVVVEFQGPEGFYAVEMATVSNSNQWGACIGDLNNSGSKDLIAGGSYDGVHHLKMLPHGAGPLENLDNGSIFMQGCAMTDLDGDGMLDVFACHDDGLSKLWKGVEQGGLEYDASLMPLTDYDYSNDPFTDHSGNYGVVTTDVNGDGHTDLYIAKCRQFVSDPFDPKRVNQLWVSDGNGGWTEEAASRGLVLFEQSWTSDFGDIDNDGDMDALITNHGAALALLQNDGTGHFTDITEGSGLDITGFFLQAKMADFDNDGHLDLMTSGGGGAQHFLLGQGDGTFEALDWPFGYPDNMLGFAVGDAEKNGTLDVYATHGGVYVTPDPSNPDVLYRNEGNNHHWVAFDLQGVTSNLDAVGARVSLYGTWGVQVREVRSGESYGMTCSHHVHFGLGNETTIDSAVVQFPGGAVKVIVSPAPDLYHEVIEAPCTLPPFAAVWTGETTLCTGDSLALSTPYPDADHLWNTGGLEHEAVVGDPGYYRAMVTTSEGCVGLSIPVRVDRRDEVTATIVTEGDLVGCGERSVILRGVAEGDWSWSDGTQADSILVTEGGAYFMELDNGCGETVRSDTVEVVFYDLPMAPAIEDAVLSLPDEVVLMGNGEVLNWYQDAGALVPDAVGIEYDAGLVDTTTTFYAEAVLEYNLDVASVGPVVQDEGGFLGNDSYWLRFDTHRDVILDSVLVFAASTGAVTVGLVDDGGALMAQIDAEVPMGASYIHLDFFVPEGEGYGLRTYANGVALWRDGVGAALAFPYSAEGLLTITSNNLSNPANSTNYYYYFYDWHLRSVSTVCTSERVSVSVISLINGCTYGSATNFNAAATHENGSCFWTGCMDPEAINYHPLNTAADESCIYSMNPPGECPADLNSDGLTGSADLLMLLADFGTPCVE